MVLASKWLRTEVQHSDQQDMPTYTEKVIGSATEVVRAAQALAASFENNWYELKNGGGCTQYFYAIIIFINFTQEFKFPSISCKKSYNCNLFKLLEN